MTPSKPPRNIEVIINPAAGQSEPVLQVLNDEFAEAGVEWHADIAIDLGEVPDFIDRAMAREVDLVAAYGGDGTVSAVATAMQGKPIPMAILPGGTGNVMAAELSIPTDLKQACRYLLEPGEIRQVDLGLVNERPFILRVGIGLEADMVNQADPEQKRKLGALAYGLAALAALREPQISNYTIEIDGQQIQQQAVTCLVINSGNLGRPELRLSQDMEIDDGLLDVALLSQVDLESISQLLASMAGAEPVGHTLKLWQGQRIRVEAEPDRQAEADGEDIGSTPFDFEVLPGKLLMLAPGRHMES